MSARAFLVTFVTSIAIAASAAACSGDDTVGTTPGQDGGGDATHADGGSPDTGGNEAGKDGGTDGDAGPCDFNAFVTDLIKNHTNNTDQPSTDLGQNCVDTQTPFPTTLFQ